MREPGYYWVKYLGDWIVAKCYKSQLTGYAIWVIPGKFNHIPENTHPFTEIDERQIKRL